MSTIEVPSYLKKKNYTLSIIFILLFVICVLLHTYHTYNSIEVIPIDKATVEVGSKEYNVEELVKEVNGEIVSVKQDIDANILGEQEVVFEVKKENVIKDVSMTVSVVDSIAPVIELVDSNITITKGDSYDFQNNIQNVSDSIDGVLDYNSLSNQSRLKTYNIEFNGDFDSVGDHEVKVLAIDNSGNVASQSFTLTVVEPEPEPEPIYYQPVYYNLPANASSGDLVSIAYSYLGYPYVGGGNSPSGFDCSGFVQFVYSQVGTWISRSTSTQIYDGYAVSYDDMQPGDIIVWGYSWGQPTHSAMYVGDGMMIHAANPSTGVILSNVQGWINGSGTQILSVRRI